MIVETEMDKKMEPQVTEGLVGLAVQYRCIFCRIKVCQVNSYGFMLLVHIGAKLPKTHELHYR